MSNSDTDAAFRPGASNPETKKYTLRCVVCGQMFAASRKNRRTCSRTCHSRRGGTSPSKRICQCGEPASKKGWCRKCSHVRKLASKRADYRRHAEARKRAERERAARPEVKNRMRQTGAEWRFNNFRQRRLDLDNHTCQHCGATEKLVVHHNTRRESARRGADKQSTIDDLLTLCRACHLRLHRELGDVIPRIHRRTPTEARYAPAAVADMGPHTPSTAPR